jgi:hypothetical protein
MTCRDCESRANGYSGIFNVSCPDCRTAIAMSESCKLSRKQLVDRMLNKWGDTLGWQSEPHCGCTKVCVRKQRTKEKE